MQIHKELNFFTDGIPYHSDDVIEKTMARVDFAPVNSGSPQLRQHLSLFIERWPMVRIFGEEYLQK